MREEGKDEREIRERTREWRAEKSREIDERGERGERGERREGRGERGRKKRNFLVNQGFRIVIIYLSQMDVLCSCFSRIILNLLVNKK